MLLLSVLFACARPAPAEALVAPQSPARPRSVILMIGDGMGPQQLGLLETYARKAPSSPYGEGRTAFRALADAGTVGLSLHYPADGLVTDSACSATQLALGEPSRNEIIGLDADGTRRENVRERAAALGKATGIVSDTRLTHATPAAFLAHQGYRSAEAAIAAQIVATDVQVALSGGRRYFVPDAGYREDGRDLLAEAGAAGFEVVTDAGGLASAGERVLGLFAEGGMPDALSARDQATVPTLAAMTEAALARLEADEDGFFLMVEGGQIDWAAHSNDAGWMLAELLRFDAALAVALAYVEAHPDTLLVVTADHETGGFGLSPSEAMAVEKASLDATHYPDGYAAHESPVAATILDRLAAQPYPMHRLFDGEGLTPQQLQERVADDWGWTLSDEAAARILSGTPLPDRSGQYPEGAGGALFAVPRALADQTGVVWSTSGHTHTPVPVLAVGPGSEAFSGLLHHVDVGRKVRAAVE